MSASILRFPLWRCPGCGHFLREPEVAHNRHCKPLAELRKRQEERERPAPPIRRPSIPHSPRKKHGARLLALRIGLDWPERRDRLIAATRLPLEALERVAASRSTLAPTQWRRVLEVLE